MNSSTACKLIGTCLIDCAVILNVWTHVNKTNPCAIQFDCFTVMGNGDGGPGSLIGCCFCLNISANCSILCEDSSMASADKSSKVTRSTTTILCNWRNKRKQLTYGNNLMGFWRKDKGSPPERNKLTCLSFYRYTWFFRQILIIS